MQKTNQLIWEHLDTADIQAYLKNPKTNAIDLKKAHNELEKRGIIVENSPPSASKSKSAAIAGIYTSGIGLAGCTIAQLAGNDTDIFSLIPAIREEMNILVKNENQETEEMLAINAITLDAIFNHMMRVSLKAHSPDTIKIYMDIALRAQNQLRKTILAIAHVKNPKQQMFIAQQNVAQFQQVNNGTTANIETKKNILNPKNELISETTNETVDF